MGPEHGKVGGVPFNCTIDDNIVEVKAGFAKDYVTGIEFLSPSGESCKSGEPSEVFSPSYSGYYLDYLSGTVNDDDGALNSLTFHWRLGEE